MSRKWTEGEVEILRSMVGKHRHKEIAKRLDRSIKAVTDKSHKLGLDHARQWWNMREVKVFKELHGTITDDELAKLMGRTRSSIRFRAISLGMTKEYSRWSEQESKVLIRLHRLGWSDEEISIKLNRKRGTVLKYRHKLGLPSNGDNTRHRKKLAASVRRYRREKRRCQDSATGNGSSGSTKRSHHCEIVEPD